TNTGVQFQLRNASGTSLATVTVPNTGWWQTYQTVSAQVTLPAGQQTLRIVTTDAKGSGWNINWWEIAGATATPPPPPPPATTGTLRIEAESYTAMSGIQTETTGDAAGGGLNVGWQENNDWMDYSVNVAAAGTYTVNFRVATTNTGVQFQLRNASGTALATVTVPNTGWWQTYQTISAQVTLPAGQQTLRIVTTDAKGSGWNINWWEIVGTATPPPPPATTTSIKIEAESYTAMSGIQTENTGDAGGGLNVGWQENNDWMDYSVNVPAAGTYTVNFRVATTNTGVQFQLRNSSGTSLATVTVPNTGWWQTYQTVSAQVTLPAGQQTLRIVTTDAKGSGWNINWWQITNNTSTGQAVKLATSGGTEVFSESIEVFPNPVTDRFFLKVDNNQTGMMNIEISDMTGKVQKQFSVIKQSSGSTQTYLPAGALAPGSYVVKVNMSGWTGTAKLIKE
ncbi:MAG TPA: carbohydrate-binding protein, partial [Flavisolibacter sp.]|nr:carbohydrate-binding protein [Flavisolibacter sp.]